MSDDQAHAKDVTQVVNLETLLAAVRHAAVGRDSVKVLVLDGETDEMLTRLRTRTSNLFTPARRVSLVPQFQAAHDDLDEKEDEGPLSATERETADRMNLGRGQGGVA